MFVHTYINNNWCEQAWNENSMLSILWMRFTLRETEAETMTEKLEIV